MAHERFIQRRAADAHAPLMVAPPAADAAPTPVIQRWAVPSTDFHLANINLAPDEETAPNRTGLPDALKSGAESLSGVALDDVRVHYGSPAPAALAALAYAQGSDIHVGPGQEQHLPHETWHVVQQKQGRVAPTGALEGQALNDDPTLEQEADQMGAAALQAPAAAAPPQPLVAPTAALQLMRAEDVKTGRTYRYQNTLGKIMVGTLESAGGGWYTFNNGKARGAKAIIEEIDSDSESEEVEQQPKRQMLRVQDEDLSSEEDGANYDDQQNDTVPDDVEDQQDEYVSEDNQSEQDADSEAEVVGNEGKQEREYLSDDTDAETEKPNLDGLLTRYKKSWKSGLGSISETKIEAILPKVRANIVKLVQDAYGPKAHDNPTDIDLEAAKLLPSGSRNCSACIDMEATDGMTKRLATYNTRQITATSDYNRKREDGEPKMHALGANSIFGGLSLGLEHAELRGADKIATDYVDELSTDDEYTASAALDSLDYIGIFQPCCVLCAVCFAVAGKADATRGYHIKNVVGWQWPPFILADPEAIKEILGAEAVKAIGDNKTNLERVLQRVASTHNNWASIW